MKIKSLIFLIAMSLQVHAMSEVAVKKYMKKYVESKMSATVSKIDVISTYPVEEVAGWNVYFLSMKVKVKMGKKYQEAIIPQTVFTKGNKITLKLMKKGKRKRNGTRRKGKSYSDLLKPLVPNSAYDQGHLIAGSHYAPHKILIFSDPFCAYCKKYAPEILKMVRENPRIYGLYYYHLPLVNIHPASDVTTKVMHIFQKRGEIDKMMELYDLFLEPNETDVNEILNSIKEKTGVLFTKAQVEAPEVKSAMRVDKILKRRLMVTGTPTIFIDGKWDRMRREFRKYKR